MNGCRCRIRVIPLPALIGLGIILVSARVLLYSSSLSKDSCTNWAHIVELSDLPKTRRAPLCSLPPQTCQFRHSTARPSTLDMAAQAFSSAKDGLAGDADSLAGAVLRRLVLTEADLPEGIQFLPSLFRLMAFLLFLPVSVLTAVGPVCCSRSAGRCASYHTSSSIPTPTRLASNERAD